MDLYRIAFHVAGLKRLRYDLLLFDGLLQILCEQRYIEIPVVLAVEQALLGIDAYR